MEIDPYQPPKSEAVLQTDPAEARLIRLSHIQHESSLKSMGFLYLVAAIFLLAAAIIPLLTTNPFGQIGMGRAVNFIGLGLGIGFGALAFGLRRLQRWALIPASLIAGLLLLVFPLGTLVGIFQLYLLLSNKGRYVLSREYHEVILMTPNTKAKTSILTWIVFLFVILFCLGIIVRIFEAY